MKKALKTIGVLFSFLIFNISLSSKIFIQPLGRKLQLLIFWSHFFLPLFSSTCIFVLFYKVTFYELSFEHTESKINYFKEDLE